MEHANAKYIIGKSTKQLMCRKGYTEMAVAMTGKQFFKDELQLINKELTKTNHVQQKLF